VSLSALPITNRMLVLEGGWAFVLEPLDDGRTRLLARGHTRAWGSLRFNAVLFEIAHFVMERK
jgi:hypothetical protein